MSLCYGEDNDCSAPHCLIEAKEWHATLARRKQRKDPLLHQDRSDNFIDTTKNVVKNKLPRMLLFYWKSQLLNDKAKCEWDRKWVDDLLNKPREYPPSTDYCTIRRGMHQYNKEPMKFYRKPKAPRLPGLEQTSEHQLHSNEDKSKRERDRKVMEELKNKLQEQKPRFDFCTMQQGIKPANKDSMTSYIKPKAPCLSGHDRTSENQLKRHSTRLINSTPDYSPSGRPAHRTLHFPNSSPKGTPALRVHLARGSRFVWVIMCVWAPLGIQM